MSLFNKLTQTNRVPSHPFKSNYICRYVKDLAIVGNNLVNILTLHQSDQPHKEGKIIVIFFCSFKAYFSFINNYLHFVKNKKKHFVKPFYLVSAQSSRDGRPPRQQSGERRPEHPDLGPGEPGLPIHSQHSRFAQGAQASGNISGLGILPVWINLNIAHLFKMIQNVK
jgi:hypothetical protein